MLQIVSRPKVLFFTYVVGKMTFIYDFQWQRTLFAQYTLLPHWNNISEAEIQSGAFENAG